MLKLRELCDISEHTGGADDFAAVVAAAAAAAAVADVDVHAAVAEAEPDAIAVAAAAAAAAAVEQCAAPLVPHCEIDVNDVLEQAFKQTCPDWDDMDAFCTWMLEQPVEEFSSLMDAA